MMCDVQVGRGATSDHYPVIFQVNAPLMATYQPWLICKCTILFLCIIFLVLNYHDVPVHNDTHNDTLCFYYMPKLYSYYINLNVYI